MQKDINLVERRDALMLRRELSKQKRLASMKQRLHVVLEGYKTHYEDMPL